MIFDSIMAFKKEDISTDLLSVIAENSKIIMLNKDEIFIRAGDTLSRVIFIAKGKVRIFSLGVDGSDRIIYILNEGHFIGEGTFLRKRENATSTRFAKAETDCVIYWIERDGYEILMQNRDFVDSLLQCSSKKNAFLRHEVENSTFLPLSMRLKNLLVACINTQLEDSSWFTLSTQFTQSDIASILGANRVTISKEIKKLCDGNFLRIVNRNIQINKSAIDGYNEDI